MRDFTKTHSEKELSVFLLPMVLSVSFQRIYSLVSTAVVSKYLGYKAVAVIGSCNACVSIQEFIFAGMTTGFGFYIYRCIGSKEKNTLSAGIWGGIYLTGALALLGLIGAVSAGVFAELMNISPQIREDAEKYLFFLLAGSGFLAFKNLLFCMIQGLGDSSISGILSMIGVVSQTVLTVWLVAGLRFGVEASALAILLNNMILCICLGIYLFWRYRTQIGYTSLLKISFSVVKEHLCSGAVKSGMMLTIGFGAVVMQKAVNKMPEGLIAANTYASVLAAFFVELFSAYATAAGIIAGQNKGSLHVANIKKYNRSVFIRCGCWCICVFVLFHAGGRWLFGLLAGRNVPEQVLLEGMRWLRICSYGYPGLVLLLVCRNVMQAMGYHRVLPMLGLIEMTINILLAGFVPAYQCLAVSISMVLKWSVPGVISYFVFRRMMRAFSAEDLHK